MPRALDTIDPAWAWELFEPTDAREWNRTLAAHLFRRAVFAATVTQIDEAVKQSPASVVQEIVRGSEDTSDFRQQSDELAMTLASTDNPRQLAAWWVDVMLHTANPLLDRMTLFWHGHFATMPRK